MRPYRSSIAEGWIPVCRAERGRTLEYGYRQDGALSYSACRIRVRCDAMRNRCPYK